MELLNCPECGSEIESRTGSCANCGFDLENNCKECYECGTLLMKSAIVCTKCGAPMSVINEDATKVDKVVLNKSKNRYIGIGMIIIACILFVISFSRVNNEKYEFYKKHYEDCEEGYIETKSMANSYSSGFFKSSYNNIADSYQDMMDNDMDEINKFRTQAVICLATGVVFIIVGTIKLRKEK